MFKIALGLIFIGCGLLLILRPTAAAKMIADSLRSGSGLEHHEVAKDLYANFQLSIWSIWAMALSFIFVGVLLVVI